MTFTVPLTGHAQVNMAHPSGGTGDPGASGTATIAIRPAARQVCYDLRLSGVAEPMMAHIHQGKLLQIGPPVIILFVGTRASLRDCVLSTHSLLNAILASPQNYYLSVDSTDFADGAVRGQLMAPPLRANEGMISTATPSITD